MKDDSNTSSTANPYAPPQLPDNRRSERRLIYYLLEACAAFATVIGICLGYIVPIAMQLSGIPVLLVGGCIMIAVMVASLRFSAWNKHRQITTATPIDLPPTQNHQ